MKSAALSEWRAGDITPRLDTALFKRSEARKAIRYLEFVLSEIGRSRGEVPSNVLLQRRVCKARGIDVCHVQPQGKEAV